MILVIGGIKGGTGKTTLSTNLAVLRSQKGHRVLLVDADEQRTTIDWIDQRLGFLHETPWPTIQLSGMTAHNQVRELNKTYTDMIIDVGGGEVSTQRSILMEADVFLIPFRPKSFDVWTLTKVNELISEAKVFNPKIQCFSVLNQADSSGTDNKLAFEALSVCENLKCIPITIGYRKSFSSASAKGMGVVEMKPKDKKAIDEMNSLYEYIYNIYT